MRVISVNVNGIRSAATKGFFTWLEQQNADVICMQEVRANEEQLTDKIFHPDGYHKFFYSAEKKGYSGVAIYSKQQPDGVTKGLGWDIADQEARYLDINFGDLHIASVYLPSGTSGDERQTVKYSFLEKFLEVLQNRLNDNRRYILCGDWNIAHKNIDLKNWRSNQDHSGFLPEERAWLDNLFDKVGYIDAYRHLHPEKVEYTWWSNRGRAWDNDVGWRIDYQIISPALAGKVVNANVYREQKFSDHAPLIVDYAL